MSFMSFMTGARAAEWIVFRSITHCYDVLIDHSGVKYIDCDACQRFKVDIAFVHA